jgi:acyl-CoA thioester hydrolase
LTAEQALSDTEDVMPRLALAALPTYDFECTLGVRTTDLNYGGHLGNDRLLALVQEARVAFLAVRALSELDAGGPSLIMADAALVYQGEAFAGDLLRFEMAAREPSRVGFRLFTRVTRPADGAAIALVETGMVCFDYSLRRPQPLSDALRAFCAPPALD